MKKKNLVILIFLFAVGVFSFVVAQNILNLIVVNALSCTETDGGLNYNVTGAITGSFWWTSGNQTLRYNGTFVDTCLSPNSTILLEGVCGSSISQNLSHLAAVAYVDCASVNKTCSAGRCV